MLAVLFAVFLAALKAGKSKPARIAMIEMTTSNSTRVKAFASWDFNGREGERSDERFIKLLKLTF
jgi:hypothetical protein